MHARDIPNLITGLRILLVVPVAWLMIEQRYGEALLLFIIAGGSDALDGFLAKHFNWTSWLGGWLDPLADKLLLVTVFVILGLQSLIPLWLVIIAVLRDLIIFSGALIYRQLYRDIDPEPRLLSKLNTLAQILLAMMILVHAWLDWFSVTTVVTTVWTVAATIIASGLDYIAIWFKRARRAAMRH
ncbi:MAG: CDP-alcohol phosphatidyltransferase family protein [Gammaproteobacteria bacterium]|nr:CDP-alcohol phosphatidyltransferase family protein [Gammaproteobacteria bacterium]MCP5137513.1 CDP-alcohol phosphatidyltransferase family protein [Gammaproteobacteria bacterium]